MTYTSGVRTSQANPGEDLYAQVAALMTAHGNYTFIEDWTLATFKWSVWRVGSLNSTGTPYFLLFNRTVANGNNLNIGLCEEYDQPSHSFTRGTPNSTSTVRTPAADYSTGTAPVALPNATALSPSLRTYEVTGDPTSYNYWIAINNDGLWIGTRVGANAPNGVLAGTFDSLVENPATNDPRPLFAGGGATANSTSQAYISFTRHPFASGSNTWWWGAYEWWTGQLTWPSAALIGQVGAATGDLFQSAKAIGARQLMRTWAIQRSGSATTYGSNRGLYRNVLCFNVAGAVAIGDTITVGSSTYVYTGRGTTFYNVSAT